ncbi:MAG: hypothetical protein BA874_12730 [Desulfuromonadales bacterium C00003068]|jgi:uncharacterized protein YjeT (DUF2065 family)|nr:MAG: hypothetical protein BA874_12730 [Desulfuromonadales bacterium C00003068]
MKFFLCVVGVVLIVEGVPWFLSPQGFKRMLLQMLPIPERVLRMMGLVLMLSGLATVYLAINSNF